MAPGRVWLWSLARGNFVVRFLHRSLPAVWSSGLFDARFEQPEYVAEACQGFILGQKSLQMRRSRYAASILN